MADKPDFSKIFGNFGVPDAVVEAQRLSRQFEDQERSMQQTMSEVSRAQSLRREKEDQATAAALELSRRILEQQQRMVESQKDLLDLHVEQGTQARHDRRIQYSILGVAIIALAVAIGAPVALETDSWPWTIGTVAVTLLVTVGGALLVIQGRRSISKSD